MPWRSFHYLGYLLPIYVAVKMIIFTFASQETFISKVFWLNLTWTEAANGDARCLCDLAKSHEIPITFKKRRETQQQYQFSSKPQNTFSVARKLHRRAGFRVFRKKMKIENSSILDSIKAAASQSDDLRPEIIRNLVEHLVVAEDDWLSIYVLCKYFCKLTF